MAFPFAATIAAQPGPQTEFLRTAADVCIYGGAAGGGKTVGLILEPLRYVSRVPGFTAVFFRRTTPQITNPGGLRLARGADHIDLFRRVDAFSRRISSSTWSAATAQPAVFGP